MLETSFEMLLLGEEAKGVWLSDDVVGLVPVSDDPDVSCGFGKKVVEAVDTDGNPVLPLAFVVVELGILGVLFSIDVAPVVLCTLLEAVVTVCNIVESLPFNVVLAGETEEAVLASWIMTVLLVGMVETDASSSNEEDAGFSIVEDDESFETSVPIREDRTTSRAVPPMIIQYLRYLRAKHLLVSSLSLA